jgi:hypothetical protein
MPARSIPGNRIQTVGSRHIPFGPVFIAGGHLSSRFTPGEFFASPFQRTQQDTVAPLFHNDGFANPIMSQGRCWKTHSPRIADTRDFQFNRLHVITVITCLKLSTGSSRDGPVEHGATSPSRPHLQISHQRLIKRRRRVDRHEVDMAFDAFVAVAVEKLVQLAQICLAD